MAADSRAGEVALLVALLEMLLALQGQGPWMMTQCLMVSHVSPWMVSQW